MGDLAIIPQPQGAGGYLELARGSGEARKKQGRVFEKHILNYGTLKHPKAPGGEVEIDDKFVDTMILNFSNGVCDIVQVPVAGSKNEHTEDPMRNIGEVIDIVKRDNKVYVHIDARNDAAADALGKTLIGASAMMDLNYTDTRTGLPAGPTLLHTAVTNRPYVTGLEDYQEVIAASANGSEDEVLMLTASDQEKNMPTKDELIAALKTEHGVDVAALLAEHDSAVALSNGLREALGETGVLTLSNGDTATTDDFIAAVAETVKSNISLSARVETLEEKDRKTAATSRVESLIRQGKIAPAEKDARVRLLLSAPDLFEEMVPATPIVALSNESEGESGELGILPLSNDQDNTLTTEIDRIVADAAAAGMPVQTSAA
jgi:hypothetical protein